MLLPDRGHDPSLPRDQTRQHLRIQASSATQRFGSPPAPIVVPQNPLPPYLVPPVLAAKVASLVDLVGCAEQLAPSAEYPSACSSVNGPFRSGTVGRTLLHTLPEIAPIPCPGAGYPARTLPEIAPQPRPADRDDRLSASYKNRQFGLKNGPNQVANGPPKYRAGESFIMGHCSPCPYICTSPISVHVYGHHGHPPYKRFLDRQEEGGE